MIGLNCILLCLDNSNQIAKKGLKFHLIGLLLELSKGLPFVSNFVACGN